MRRPRTVFKPLLTTIYIALLGVKTQTEAASTIAKSQLEAVHSDQVRYNAVLTTIEHVTSVQKPNIVNAL